MLPQLPESTPAERIYKARVHHQMTRRELATKLDVTQQSILNWETGVTLPSTDIAIRMAALWKVSLDWLLTGSEPVAKEAV